MTGNGPAVERGALAPELMRALADPIRWSIVKQISSVDELACSSLEETLPVSKPTISYHMKILTQAGLVKARKSGRNHHYSLERDVFNDLVDAIWALAPTPRPVRDGKIAHQSARRRHHPESGRLTAAPDQEAVLLTW